MGSLPQSWPGGQPSASKTDTAHDVYVARQPIFDRRRRVFGYELLFRSGFENVCRAVDLNAASGQVMQAMWLTFDLDTLIGQKRAFVNLTRDLLVTGYGRTLPAHLTVIELLETVTPDDAVVEACRALKASGYMIALDDFVYRSGHERLLELADIVKLCFRDTDYKTQIQHVRRLGPNVKLLAEKVETREEYDQAVALGCDYFQGYFFCRPEIVSGRALSGFRLSYLRLLQAVTRPDVSLDELDNVIRSDVSIVHRLMKYLGSAHFGWRGPVHSVRQGLVLLGREHTRRWVSLVALGEIGRDKPQELLINAAVRAKFCEGLAPEALGDRESDLFLLGAFSVIDAMLDLPMAEALAHLPLADDLRAALEGRDSALRPFLELVAWYERGEWEACRTKAHGLGVDDAAVPGLYMGALDWAAGALGD